MADITDSPVLKLADFGLAQSCENGWLHEYGGTLAYMSLEQMDDWCHACCDVWAVGVVMYVRLDNFPVENQTSVNQYLGS